MTAYEKIAALCAERGITPAQLAKELGFSSGLMSHWKRGARKPTADNLAKVAAYFGVLTSYLLGEIDHPHGAPPKEKTPAPTEQGPSALVMAARESKGQSLDEARVREIIAEMMRAQGEKE